MFIKKYSKIFTVLPIALIATPCFAATDNQSVAPKKLKSENLAKEIMNSAKKLKLGDSISFENGYAASLGGATDALQQWSDACNALAGKNGVQEVLVESTEQSGQKIYTCSLVECQNTHDKSKNEKSCVLKNTTEEEKTDTESTEEKLTKEESDEKAKEQSLANRALTAATTAATGIGGMELAMGLSQQKADKEADADMAAYLETFRCTYGDGKSVKAGTTEIELPGGNDQTMMNYRAEYLALATDLKERKAALGMAPGIESEIIMDKAAMGLYDDENVGITGGNYESLYRAKMLGSETDQAKIDEQKEASKKRVMGGTIAAGAGAVVGVVGNSLINGKLGEAIKAAKERRNSKVDTEETITVLDLKEKISTLSEEDLEELRKVLGIK